MAYMSLDKVFPVSKRPAAVYDTLFGICWNTEIVLRLKFLNS